MKKKIVSLVMAVALVLSLSGVVSAATKYYESYLELSWTNDLEGPTREYQRGTITCGVYPKILTKVFQLDVQLVRQNSKSREYYDNQPVTLTSKNNLGKWKDFDWDEHDAGDFFFRFDAWRNPEKDTYSYIYADIHMYSE